MVLDKEKLSYWAAFLDGEGHIKLDYRKVSKRSPRGGYVFQVYINQWTEEPDVFFGELKETFGGRVIAIRGTASSYRWYIGGDGGRRFLEAVVPYLRAKKRQAELGIGLQLLMRGRRGGPGRALEKEEILARDEMLKENYGLIRGSRIRRERRLGHDVRMKGGRP